MRGAIVFALFFFAACVLAKNKLTGINLSGAAFASDKVPGKPGYDYFFPTTSHMDYFLANKKMNVVRFPILWERIQPSLNSPLDTVYANSLIDTVKYVTDKNGKYLILDVHNYQRYRGNFVGEGSVKTADLLDLYSKLYTLLSPYKEKVIWGIMNEPEGKDYKMWAEISQDFINHMRKIGSTQLLLIPGLSYTGAGSWGSTNNYHEMWNLTDPLNNFAMEIHMYHDSDSSGTSEICSSENVGVTRMNYVTDWMRAYSRKAFLGETGAGRNDKCYSAITNTLKFMSDNDDVWLGWTWWAGGHGWGDYPYTLTPFENNQDPPQWPYITPYVADSVPTVAQLRNEVKNYPHAGNVKIPIYNGRLNMMSNPSWTTTKEQDAAKTYTSKFSFSFIAGGPASNAMQWTCKGCFDTTLYSGLEFYIATEGKLSDLRIRMIDYVDNKWSSVSGETSVQTLATGSADSNGWTRCFMDFSTYDGERHGGFMIWSSPVRPIAYLDAVSLIHRFDSDFISPSLVTTTTGKPVSTPAPSTTGNPTSTPSSSTTAKPTTTPSSTTGKPVSTPAPSTTGKPTSTPSSSTTAKHATTGKPATTVSSTTGKPATTVSTTTGKPAYSPLEEGGDMIVGSSSSSLEVFGVSFVFLFVASLFLF